MATYHKVKFCERKPSIIGSHSTYVGQLECGHGFARVCKWVSGRQRYIPGEPKRLRCRECERHLDDIQSHSSQEFDTGELPGEVGDEG